MIIITIKESIELSLSEIADITNIDYYYLKRENNSTNCIIYLYKEYPNNNADGEEEDTQYDVYFTLVCVNKITEKVDIIKKILAKNGFSKVVINPPNPIEDNGTKIYEVTMNYKIILESEEI